MPCSVACLAPLDAGTLDRAAKLFRIVGQIRTDPAGCESGNDCFSDVDGITEFTKVSSAASWLVGI